MIEVSSMMSDKLSIPTKLNQFTPTLSDVDVLQLEYRTSLHLQGWRLTIPVLLHNVDWVSLHHDICIQASPV